VCTLVGLWADAGDVFAGLYAFTDEQGIVHVTNRPPVSSSVEQRLQSRETDVVPVPGFSRSLIRRSAQFEHVIKEAADYYSLPVALVRAVIAAESNFEASAVSRAGALGLMQLRPQTAAAMSVSNSFDPRDNVFGGARYLRLMLNQFQGDVVLAAAAYNAGPSAVERARGIPPFKETRDYVARVLRLYARFQAP
jgi:soluble lytic murein transglycosylase